MNGNVVGSAITGTVVSHNQIEREDVDIAVSDPEPRGGGARSRSGRP
jgi:hypothetical protein